jgi:hypothetical protein
MAEDDVATEIPRKPSAVHDRRGKTAWMVLLLEDDPVVMAKAIKLASASQPARAATDDDDSAFQGNCVWHLR